MGRAQAARGLILAALLGACGGAPRSASSPSPPPPAAAEAPRRSCEATCAFVATCGGACVCDDSPLFVCLASSDTCAEVEECRM